MGLVVGLHFEFALNKKKWVRKKAREVTNSELHQVKRVHVYRTVP